jgi:hypothetical protein
VATSEIDIVKLAYAGWLERSELGAKSPWLNESTIVHWGNALRLMFACSKYLVQPVIGRKFRYILKPRPTPSIADFVRSWSL